MFAISTLKHGIVLTKYVLILYLCNKRSFYANNITNHGCRYRITIRWWN